MIGTLERKISIECLIDRVGKGLSNYVIIADSSFLKEAAIHYEYSCKRDEEQERRVSGQRIGGLWGTTFDAMLRCMIGDPFIEQQARGTRICNKALPTEVDTKSLDLR